VPIYWVEQLMSYMSMMGAEKGWMVIFNVFTTQIMAFQMKLSPDDILGWLITISERANKVRRAVKIKDASDLPINPKLYNMCDYKKDCPRRDECHNRWKEMQKEKEKARREKKRNKKESPLK